MANMLYSYGQQRNENETPADRAKRLLNEKKAGEWVGFFYTFGAAEIKSVTASGRFYILDCHDKRSFVTPEQFNRYNYGCDAADVVRLMPAEQN